MELNNSIISKTFEKSGIGKIKIALLNGEPMFNLYDTCFNLGYVRTVKPKGKEYIQIRKEFITKLCESLNITGLATDGKTFKITYKNRSYIDFENTWITEQNFYDLCLESHAKNARSFRKWVTGEVLPSIRKTGKYETHKEIPLDSYMIENPVKRAERWIEEYKEKQELENKVKDLKPKADYTERILNNPGLVTISQIAKDYGKSGSEMNKLLHTLKIQYKKSGQWMLYSKYDDKGYVHSSTVDIVHKDGTKDVSMHTKWTQAGRLFLYNILKSNGILPLIERQQQVMNFK